MKTNLLQFVAVLLLCASPAMARNLDARILVMGDSLLAAHSSSGRAVAHSIARTLGEPVINKAVVGARIIYRLPITGALGLNIGKQYRRGQWDWIVLNGGGNDLWLGCGCNKCARKMQRLISEDGTRGEVPKLVSKLRKTGAKVIYVGYLRSPGIHSPLEGCEDEGDKFEGRISNMAAHDKGVYFLSLADLVPYRDLSYHAIDRIHPSLKASKTIGQMVSKIIGKSPE